MEKLLHFSRRSDNLSVDLAPSIASVVSCVAADRRVDLSIELADVVFVENSDFISLVVAAVANVVVIAGGAGFRVFQLLEDFAQSVFISRCPF